MNRRQIGILAVILLVLAGLHAATATSSEPFFNNDESRHVMTGIFFRDAMADLAKGEWSDLRKPKAYAERYYMQYPALGLLTWPPLFHAIEGLWMLLFGPCHIAARILVGIFTAVGIGYYFALVCRTHDVWTATASAALLGLTPLVFVNSRHVMLEAPTLAFVLAALCYFVVYLEAGHARHLWLAVIASSCAALTRFDAVLLAPLFFMLIAVKGQWGVLRAKQLWAAALLGLVLVVPYYLFALSESGWMHFSTTPVEGATPLKEGLAIDNFGFYLNCLPEHVGWVMLCAAALGIITLFMPAERRRIWPYLCLILATALVLVPYPEQEPRHIIYAMPGLALLAASGVITVITRIGAGWLALPVVAGVIASTGYESVRNPALFVRGYDEAARYVLAETKDSRTCLFDNFLNGTYICLTRHADSDRRLWILRGDKLLYSVLSDPRIQYKEHVADKQDLLDTIFRYDPAFIVVEEPQIYVPLPMSERLREVLRENPDQFRLEREIPIESNYRLFQGVKLLVYRNLHRNPRPIKQLEIELQGLRRNVRTELNR
jgi:hypothetical protein